MRRTKSSPPRSSDHPSGHGADGEILLRLLAATAQDDGTVILRLLSAAVEHSPDGVAVSISDVSDPSELQIVYANPAFEALADCGGATLIGRDPLSVVKELVDRPTRRALAGAVSRRTPLQVECTLAAPGGAGTFEVRATPISRVDDHPLTEWVWNFRDITGRFREERSHQASLKRILRERNRRLAEAQAELRIMQRLAPMATLAGGLGHDMNNLLLPMRAHLESLVNAVSDPDALEHLTALQSVLRYLQQLTDALRLMALDPDRASGAGERTDLTEWWKTTEPLLSSVIRSPTRLSVELPGGLPPVRVPPHLLTLAVLNLLVNANDASTGKAGTVRISARPRDHGASVQVDVTDDGCGMSPEVRARAFDPFFSTKRRSHAIGLGLALVHGVVRSADGTVEVDSREGAGTTVTLTLRAAEAGGGVSSSGEERKAVVLVEDVRKAALLRAMLAAWGFTPGDHPATCSVLVTDPTPEALEEVRQLRARADDVRVFVCGPRSPEWDRVGAAAIDRDAGPSEIGRILSRLVLATDKRGSR